MNIYDTANRLTQEMRESEEYKNYKKLKDSIESNPDKKAKLEEFENMRYEMQLGTIKGTENEEENKEKLKQLQEKYIQLLQDEEMRQYFDYEIKFNVMVTDVNKIIAEAIKDVL